ncbi:hypothetical protein PTTG_30222, partial [Puccinia triticina 1-1 BBBD Race 1]
ARQPLIPQLDGGPGGGQTSSITQTQRMHRSAREHLCACVQPVKIAWQARILKSCRLQSPTWIARAMSINPQHARSPAAHTISRLNFGRPQSPTRGRPLSPTRKTPASRSRSDSMASWITESVPTANYPLNKAGKALTIEGFLDLSCFDKGDVITRGLLAMSHIRR